VTTTVYDNSLQRKDYQQGYIMHVMQSIKVWNGMDKNNKQRDAKDKSHKHHNSTESTVSGGDPKRELVPHGRLQ